MKRGIIGGYRVYGLLAAVVLLALGLSLALPQSVLAQTWANTGSLNVPRAYHTATLFPDGKVLVAGGVLGSGLYLGTAELYGPKPPRQSGFDAAAG